MGRQHLCQGGLATAYVACYRDVHILCVFCSVFSLPLVAKIFKSFRYDSIPAEETQCKINKYSS